MSATYDANVHTHASIRDYADRSPQSIIHTTGGRGKQPLRVWINVTYACTLPDGALPVSDGTCDGYDDNGIRIISVPAESCTFLTEDEALSIEAMMDADADLLRYAIG